MTTYPEEFLRVIIPFGKLFSKPVFKHVKLMLAGAIPAPGKRTVSALLCIVGLSREKKFHKYHRVLSLACWSAQKASLVLLTELLKCFLPEGPVIVGIDETLERRWGRKIEQRGIYRDSVRSSNSQFVKSSGLRWISLMLLVPVSWAKRVWALPFLTVLAASERYNQGHGKKHKKLTDWARQMLLQLNRWLPKREIIAVGDSSYAVIDLLAALAGKVSFITRLRLDAALYEPLPLRREGQVGRSRKKGKRLPTLTQVAQQADTEWQRIVFSHWYGHKEKCMQVATGRALWYHSGKPPVAIQWVLLRDPEGKLGTSALLSTDLTLTAEQSINYFVRRWSIEVTFQEVRAHLGVETQRQWSAKAIARSTPVLLGLFSLITLIADSLQGQGKLQISQAAWYEKKHPTFSDAIACVRQLLWQESSFCMSAQKDDMVKLPRGQLLLFQQALTWAA
ncbi:transposase [Rhodocytophaga aerolata]|uniref:Transposase n=1 Tax=Rhodocytophaga aerolata TaxID=455078 RepID=A0ABT8RHS3_9BACT|nr:transposase [Rhodocytophaga aerolata]MDO1451638.1 transposase [Rhodocytophaga aerolata]